MAGNGTTNFPFTKGNILPDTPTTATQTHTLSGTKSIGGKKSRRSCLEKKTKGGKDNSGKEQHIEKMSEVAATLPIGGKKSKKNKHRLSRRRKTKKFLWFF